MYTPLSFEFAMAAAVVLLSFALIVLFLPNDVLLKFENWQEQLPSPRRPLTLVLAVALAISLWVVADAAFYLWTYYQY